MRPPAAFRLFAFAHLLVMLVLSIGWLWSQAWLYAAVSDMSDELSILGALDADKAATIRGHYASTGLWLMQTWDGTALGWGVAACLAGLAGSLVMLVLSFRRTR